VGVLESPVTCLRKLGFNTGLHKNRVIVLGLFWLCNVHDGTSNLKTALTLRPWTERDRDKLAAALNLGWMG
jgi:hypothetical protein